MRLMLKTFSYANWNAAGKCTKIYRTYGYSMYCFWLLVSRISISMKDLPNLFCNRYPAYQYLATVHLPYYQ
jgi:hypothetical protein